jgi:MFS family permease
VRRRSAGGPLVAALALLILLPATGQTILVPALPGLARDLGATPDEVAWTVTGYLITASIGTPLLGRLGDLFGRRRMVGWALALFCAGSLICALGESLGTLIAGRLLQGFVGGVFGLNIALLREHRPAGLGGRDTGVIAAVAGVGSIAGLVAGGLLVESGGLAALFWVQLALGLAGALAVRLVVPPDAGAPGVRADLRGALLLPAAMATLGNPTVRLANVATFLVGAAMFGLFVLTPQLVQADPALGYGFGLDAAEAGLVLLPGGLLMLIAGPLSGSVGRRVGHHVPLALGSVVTALGLLALALEHSTVAVVVVFAALTSLGVGIAFPAMPNLVVSGVRPGQIAEVAGFNSLLRGVGSAAGTQVCAVILTASAVAGSTTPAQDGYVFAFLLTAAAGAGAAATMLLVPRALRRNH